MTARRRAKIANPWQQDLVAEELFWVIDFLSYDTIGTSISRFK
jgi:hypothetical protein